MFTRPQYTNGVLLVDFQRVSRTRFQMLPSLCVALGEGETILLLGIHQVD